MSFTDALANYNPMDVQDPGLDREAMSWWVRWPLNILEYLIRIMAAISVSILSLLVAVLPGRRGTLRWIGILKFYCTLFESREEERIERSKNKNRRKKRSNIRARR